MSEAAESLRRLASQVEQAAGALREARFREFAELAAQIEQAETGWRGSVSRVPGDAGAEAECRKLRRSLDRLGALIGHVAGLQQALGALDPARGAGYGRNGTGAAAGRTRLREEA